MYDNVDEPGEYYSKNSLISQTQKKHSLISLICSVWKSQVHGDRVEWQLPWAETGGDGQMLVGGDKVRVIQEKWAPPPLLAMVQERAWEDETLTEQSGRAWRVEKPSALTMKVNLQCRKTTEPCLHSGRPWPDWQTRESRNKVRKQPMWWISISQVCMGPTISSLPKSRGRCHWCSVCSQDYGKSRKQWRVSSQERGQLRPWGKASWQSTGQYSSQRKSLSTCLSLTRDAYEKHPFLDFLPILLNQSGKEQGQNLNTGQVSRWCDDISFAQVAWLWPE